MTEVRQALVAKIEDQMASLRDKMAIRVGDEMDVVLVGVEGLARAMSELAADVETHLLDGQGQRAALLFESLPRRMLLGFAVLPACIGAVTAALILVVGTIVISANFRELAMSADRRYEVAGAELARRYDELGDRQKALFAADQAEYDRRASQFRADYSQKLVDRAAKVEGDIRDFLQAEASQPGFLNWIKRFGLPAQRLLEKNGNNFCPITYEDIGARRSCVFVSP